MASSDTDSYYLTGAGFEEKLPEKFAHIYEVIRTEDFLACTALSGEIPFWISPYNPRQEVPVLQEIRQLTKKLSLEGIEVLDIHLLQLVVEVVDAHAGLEGMLQRESRTSMLRNGKQRFRERLRSSANIHDRLVPRIQELIEARKPQVLFLYGVGAAYPVLRSHNVLNELQSVVTGIPLLMFFPGEYDGRSLDIFGLLRDDNYYRAFNIDSYRT